MKVIVAVIVRSCWDSSRRRAWAQEKKLTPVSYTLNWYPQAEHGGLYHAKATGIFEKYGARRHPAAGRTAGERAPAPRRRPDRFHHGHRDAHAERPGAGRADRHRVRGVSRRIRRRWWCHARRRGPRQAAGPQGQADPAAGHRRATNYWPWLKSKFGFTDEQIRGFEPGYAALGSDKMLSQQGFVTNDAWNARKVGLNLHSLLLADYGWANYATTIDVTEKTLKERHEVVRASCAPRAKAGRATWQTLRRPTPPSRRTTADGARPDGVLARQR